MTDRLDLDRAAPTDPSQPLAIKCGDCGRPITARYFEAGGKTLCPICRGRLGAALGKGSYLRGLGLGLLAAILGATIYFVVAAITGYEIGLIAILVGFLVGQGVKRGSRSAGGRKFQVTAALLTYFAIALSYSGIMAKEMIANGNKADVKRAGLSARHADLPTAAPAVALDSASAGPTAPANSRLGAMAVPAGLAAAVVFVMLVPVMVIVAGLPGSLLSLLIMGFGVMQAWKLNQRVELAITGPFTIRPQESPLPLIGEPLDQHPKS